MTDPTRVLGDVDGARALDDLGVDRALEAGLEAVRAAREVDPPTCALGDLGERLVEPPEGRLDVGGELLGPILDPQHFAEQP